VPGASRTREGRGTDEPAVGRKVLPREVARQVEGWVRARRFGAGSKLPPERELAMRLGTSRNVLREALKILETRGAIEVRHGVGTFISDKASPGRMTIPVQLRLEASQLSLEEVLVARRTIECAVVEVGARNRDEMDLAELRASLETAAKAEELHDRATFVKADLGFHELLGQCTHNPLLGDVQTEITRSTAAVRGIASETHDAMRAALRFHGEIVDAFARGDSEAARAVMLLHLIDAGERALGALLDDVQAEASGPQGGEP
jgi:GntR family transcriptional regulator, transcriptional repressor for pyruvate dehydrogenase complex